MRNISKNIKLNYVDQIKLKKDIMNFLVSKGISKPGDYEKRNGEFYFTFEMKNLIDKLNHGVFSITSSKKVDKYIVYLNHQFINEISFSTIEEFTNIYAKFEKLSNINELKTFK